MRRVHLVSGRVECPDSTHLLRCLEHFFDENGCERVQSRDAADIVVLNGCERIAETPEVVKAHRGYALEHPDKTVLVIGCVPEVPAAGAANFHVIPFRRLVRDPSLIGPSLGFRSAFELLDKDDVFNGHFPVEERYPGDPSGAQISLLTIGSGCRGACSFCTIRRGRGASLSRSPADILSDARSALERGRFRFVLLADDAGCWGQDLGLDLPWLLERLRELRPDARFLVRPLNPAHLPAMFERLRPHFGTIDYLYLPLQSGSDRILQLMKRGYEAAPVLDLLREMKSSHPGMHTKTDIIVGFPSETRDEFRASVIAGSAFDAPAFHRFVAYPGTAAARLPEQVAPDEIGLRMAVVKRLNFNTVDPSAYSYELDAERS